MPAAVDLKLDHLPVLPGVVVRLMELSPGSDSYFDEVLRVSAEDPSLAVRVIHAANSALSSPRQPIETLQGAVARLGATHIGSLVTAMAMTRVFAPDSPAVLDLWLHAVEVGAASRLMVANSPFGVDQHHAYLCGLLHDIGRFVMFAHAPAAVRNAEEGGWAVPAALIAAECEAFGFDHTEIGLQVCTRWSIPRRIAAVVHDHHRPVRLEPPVPADQRLAAIVQIADRLSVLSRTGLLAPVADDRAALVALITEHCINPDWPAPPVSPELVASIVPHVLRLAGAAATHLRLVEDPQPRG
ncbi:MAG TPA: HDOD domain-containing protein [Acidimicrobiales bacterium]|nr:HDOD domain-containing protein [Acidimicrobiales bacterium]